LDSFAPYPKNPTIARFFLQLGRVEELGFGVLNVTHYLPKYVPGALPRFFDGSVFQTLLPLTVSQLGPEAVELLLHLLSLPVESARITHLATLSLPPALPAAYPSATALVYRLGLGWLRNGTRLKLEKKAAPTYLVPFKQWQELSILEKGTRLFSERLLQLLRVLVLCLQSQPLAAILHVLGVSNRTKFRISYVEPLLQRRFLTLTLPEIPSSPNQRYQTTEQGQLLLTGG
jgi:hypothetical protein